jgi:hypothetical protein
MRNQHNGAEFIREWHKAYDKPRFINKFPGKFFSSARASLEYAIHDRL